MDNLHRFFHVYRGRQCGKEMLLRILSEENKKALERFEKEHAGSISIIDRVLDKKRGEQ